MMRRPLLWCRTRGVVVLSNCRAILSCRGQRLEYAPLKSGRFSEHSTSSRRMLLQLEQTLVQASGPKLRCRRLSYAREICVPLLPDFRLTLGSKWSACGNRLLGEFRMRCIFDLKAG